MHFPKDNNALDQIFINGSEPSIETFTDEYWVTMLTGMIPNFRWAGHRKRFVIEKEEKIGENIILASTTFGFFKVEEGQCDELNNIGVVILNYGEKKNILTRSVRDKIRQVESGIYLGRYYTFIDKTYHFKGYFSLEKRSYDL